MWISADSRHNLTDLTLVVLGAAVVVMMVFQPLVVLGGVLFVAVLVVGILHPEWILYALIFTLPLQGVLVLTYGANIKVSELLGCILILAVGGRRLIWREPSGLDPRITGPLIIFLALMLFSTLNTVRLRGNMVLNEYMQPGLGRDAPDTRSYITALWGVYCALLLVSVPAALRSMKNVYRAFRVLLWSGAAASAFGIFDWIYLLQAGVPYALPGSTQHLNVVHSTAGGFPRSPSSFTEPSVFAFFLIMLLPVTLALAVGSYPHIVRRRTAFLVFVLDSIALLLSFSVSGYVMFLIVLLLFTYLAALRGAGSKVRWVGRRVVAGLMAMLVIFSLLQFVGVYPEDVGEFVEQRLTGEADSAQVRFGFARVALQMAQDHYVTGVGIGNFPFMAMGYDAARSVTLVEFMVPTPSNLFLLFLAELGGLGILVFLWLVSGVYRFLASSHREMPSQVRLLYAGLCASMAGALLSFLFLDNLFVNYLWVVLGLALALHRVARTTTDGMQTIGPV